MSLPGVVKVFWVDTYLYKQPKVLDDAFVTQNALYHILPDRLNVPGTQNADFLLQWAQDQIEQKHLQDILKISHVMKNPDATMFMVVFNNFIERDIVATNTLWIQYAKLKEELMTAHQHELEDLTYVSTYDSIVGQTEETEHNLRLIRTAMGPVRTSAQLPTFVQTQVAQPCARVQFPRLSNRTVHVHITYYSGLDNDGRTTITKHPTLDVPIFIPNSYGNAALYVAALCSTNTNKLIPTFCDYDSKKLNVTLGVLPSGPAEIGVAAMSLETAQFILGTKLRLLQRLQTNTSVTYTIPDNIRKVYDQAYDLYSNCCTNLQGINANMQDQLAPPISMTVLGLKTQEETIFQGWNTRLERTIEKPNTTNITKWEWAPHAKTALKIALKAALIVAKASKPTTWLRTLFLHTLSSLTTDTLYFATAPVWGVATGIGYALAWLINKARHFYTVKTIIKQDLGTVTYPTSIKEDESGQSTLASMKSVVVMCETVKATVEYLVDSTEMTTKEIKAIYHDRKTKICSKPDKGYFNTQNLVQITVGTEPNEIYVSEMLLDYFKNLTLTKIVVGAVSTAYNYTLKPPIETIIAGYKGAKTVVKNIPAGLMKTLGQKTVAPLKATESDPVSIRTMVATYMDIKYPAGKPKGFVANVKSYVLGSNTIFVSDVIENVNSYLKGYRVKKITTQYKTGNFEHDVRDINALLSTENLETITVEVEPFNPTLKPAPKQQSLFGTIDPRPQVNAESKAPAVIPPGQRIIKNDPPRRVVTFALGAPELTPGIKTYDSSHSIIKTENPRRVTFALDAPAFTPGVKIYDGSRSIIRDGDFKGKLQNVVGDGNCLYYAFLVAAYPYLRDEPLYKACMENSAYYTIENYVHRVRNAIANKLKSNRSAYVSFFESDETVAQRVQQIKTDYVWGGEIEIKLLAEVFDTRIKVWSEKGEIWTNTYGPHTGLIVRLCFRGEYDGGHYNAILPQLFDIQTLPPILRAMLSN